MKMLRQGITFSVFFLVCWTAVARAQEKLEVGEIAPDLVLEGLLQGPSGLAAKDVGWETLEGNVVVLEFWATWCAPCIAALPHLNELAREFQGQPVRFLSITTEEAPVVQRFLERRRMRSWIGLDLDRSVQNAYQAHAIPKTVVIGPTGRIAQITYPQQLTGKSLSDLLAKEGNPLPTPLTDSSQTAPSAPSAPATSVARMSSGGVMPSTEPDNDEPDPILKVEIEPAASESSSYALGRNVWDASSISLRKLFAQAWGISAVHVLGEEVDLERYFTFFVSAPGQDPADFKLFLQRILPGAFKLKAMLEKRKSPVYVLTAPQGAAGNLLVSETNVGHFSTDEGLSLAQNWSIGGLVSGIEEVLETPILDETGLTGKYDWDLQFDPENPKSIIDAVADQLKLELEQQEREIEVLVVRPAHLQG